ncbi:MFS transporter [Actinophytocola xanthii]|uniref:MFS transporter n=1 Tax=Actinophytocola xanthii TaxID=1912961 RepID=A0A1Q8CAE8_9PSEU|nr:MFS transporter [Actinophytocola xanthii]OLF11302.1 MFS transporter [Actinophytocola xanthii]
MSTNPAAGTARLAGRREWLGLAVLALPTLLLSIDLGVLYLALPNLSADLGPSSTQTLWIMDIYAFMTAGFLVTMGTLGDRIGRRRLLMIGGAAFGVASVLAAFSTSPEMLIATRALLGVAGATLAPSTLALISNMFADERQRGMAIGVWMSCFMAGTALGPVIGGLMLQWFWWGSVFLLGVPVMALLLVTAPLLLPEYRDRDAGRIDLFSVALSMAAILPVIWGVKEIARHGADATHLLSIAVGVAVGVGFVLRQRTLADPLVDVRLFRIPSFAGALGILLLVPVVMGGTGLFVNQYLQLVEGLSPIGAALWLLPSTVVTVTGAVLAPAVAQKIGPGRTVLGGAVILVAGALLLSLVGATYGLPLLIGGVTVIGLGFSPMASLGTDLVVGAAPPEKAGSAASMSEACSELGVALGVAVLGAVGTAVYRGEITETMPDGVPAATADAVGDTLAGALAVAGDLGGDVGPAVLAAAREAFTSGLNAVGLASAGVGVALAVIAAVLLRGRGTAPADEAVEVETEPETARTGS